MSDASGSDKAPNDEGLDVLFLHASEQESEDTPMEEWSPTKSEARNITRKRLLYNQGEFIPPSQEICTNYIPQSDSQVFKHPYYNYPAITDPGIKKALLKPEKHYAYPSDGQDLYIELCKNANLAPIRKFYRSLMDSKIDLKYYGVSSKMVRVMALALSHNPNVKSLDLTDNFIDEDACFHIGELLLENHSLTEINLSGCRIKPIGLNRVLAGAKVNVSLKSLNLSSNQLDDEGGLMFADALNNGLVILRVRLSNNNLSEVTINALALALQYHCKITHWDLSRNKLFNGPPICRFLHEIGMKGALKSIDLSWNAMKGPFIGAAISELFAECPKLKYMNISNNSFEDEETIQSIVKHLLSARKLLTLDLSSNPLKPAHALIVLKKMTSPRLKITQLLFDNICVNEVFIKLREKVLQMKGREKTVITYGEVIPKISVSGPDLREVVLKRIDYLGQKQKKNKFDIAVWAMKKVIKDNVDLVNSKDLPAIIANDGLSIDDGLADSIGVAFIGKITAKEKLVSLKLVAEYAQRLWPDRKMPSEEPSPNEPLVNEEKK